MEKGFKILLSDFRGKGNHEHKDTFDLYSEHSQWQVSKGNGIYFRGSKNEVEAESGDVSSVSRDPAACESGQGTNKGLSDDFTNFNNLKLHWGFFFFVLISLED